MLEVDGWYIDEGFTIPGTTRGVLECFWHRGPVWKQPRVSDVHDNRWQRLTLKRRVVPEPHHVIPRDSSGDVLWKENIESLSSNVNKSKDISKGEGWLLHFNFE